MYLCILNVIGSNVEQLIPNNYGLRILQFVADLKVAENM